MMGAMREPSVSNSGGVRDGQDQVGPSGCARGG